MLDSILTCWSPIDRTLGRFVVISKAEPKEQVLRKSVCGSELRQRIAHNLGTHTSSTLSSFGLPANGVEDQSAQFRAHSCSLALSATQKTEFRLFRSRFPPLRSVQALFFSWVAFHFDTLFFARFSSFHASLTQDVATKEKKPKKSKMWSTEHFSVACAEQA